MFLDEQCGQRCPGLGLTKPFQQLRQRHGKLFLRKFDLPVSNGQVDPYVLSKGNIGIPA